MPDSYEVLESGGHAALVGAIKNYVSGVVPGVDATLANQGDAADAKATGDALSGKLATTGNAYRAASIPMGQLDSTSTSTVMTATVAGITELRDGVCMWLKNGVVTSASGVTLNINGLGAKPIYNSMTEASAVTTTFNVAYTMLFVYNSTRVTGGCWDMVYGYDSSTTYTPLKLGFGYATCSTAATTAAKTASLSNYTLTTNGIVAIKFTNDVPANATLNVNSKGAKVIYYRGAAITADIIKAGDTATFIYSTQYHLVSIDRANDIADGSVTTDKLAGSAVTSDKLARGAVTRNEISDSLYNELSDIDFVATDATTQTVMANSGQTAVVIAPNAFGGSSESNNSRTRLCWFTMANGLEVAPIGYTADIQGVVTFYARGLRTMASGTMNDTSWTITTLPTDGDGVSY